MRKISYIVRGNDIIIPKKDFSLDQTLDCGQAFRWERTSSGNNAEYHGYFLNNELHISEEKDTIILHHTSEQDYISVWHNYFDMDTDYSELKRMFSEDETLSLACKYAEGIRLLRQDKWEALISFIISQNNNIPRIKGIVSRLCERYGGFPSAEQMKGVTAEELAFLRAGFRGKYIEDCVSKVNTGEINLVSISDMPIEDARKELIKIKGVGPKVAECALLYGMYRIEAFPVDVWIKRVMAKFYPNGLPVYLDTYKGIAQQYLFHYMRTFVKFE